MTPTLTTISSSSHGNGYLLQCGDDALIIECGVPVNDVMEVLDYDIKNVSGVILSHAHRPRPRGFYKTIPKVLQGLF